MSKDTATTATDNSAPSQAHLDKLISDVENLRREYQTKLDELKPIVDRLQAGTTASQTELIALFQRMMELSSADAKATTVRRAKTHLAFYYTDESADVQAQLRQGRLKDGPLIAVHAPPTEELRVTALHTRHGIVRHWKEVLDGEAVA